jgi:hypothetical protein
LSTCAELTHSGDNRLAWHHANAILREDARGARLSKEPKDSLAAHRRRGGRRHGRFTTPPSWPVAGRLGIYL